METSRSDRKDGLEELRLPATATAAEAAAATAAIETYLAEERAAGAADEGRDWEGRRWTFAGRLTALGLAPKRVPDGSPADGWTAAGRADRF